MGAHHDISGLRELQTYVDQVIALAKYGRK
jgi:hypothetical protein